MADIVPAWMWRDPGEIIEALLAVSARREAGPVGDGGASETCLPAVSGRSETRPIISISDHAPARTPRDRYYTMARRLHVKQLMKERG